MIIYLTEKDIFKKGSTVYNVDMSVYTDTKEFVNKWNCGLKVMYVNTVGLSNETMNEYLKLLTDITTINTKYKEISKIKKEINKTGGKCMSKWFMDLNKKEREEGYKEGKQEGRQEGMQQGRYEIVFSFVNDGIINEEEAAKKLNITVQKFRKLRKSRI